MRCSCASVCVYVCSQDVSNKIYPINFILGGSLPSDAETKWLDFEKNRPGVRVVWGSEISAQMIRDGRKNFERL